MQQMARRPVMAAPLAESSDFVKQKGLHLLPICTAVALNPQYSKGPWLTKINHVGLSGLDSFDPIR
jgi:hypothetical protein